ncbi:VOC family protein [Isoptericola aurantiacus]|uniref:VOC family protein n=1 Tax=Isoptericola aurantiacus TaxID=3377839 RepID=UPI00383BABA2
MPARGDVADGAPIWIDLGTNDLDAAVTFYTELFGWDHVSFGEEFGNYGQFLHQGAPVAGVGPNMAAGQPSEWTVYLATSDADAAARRVAEHGGTLLVEPDDVPEQGRFFVAVDPAGGPVAFWQPGAHTGFARVMEPGAPCWFEAWSTDYDATTAFYRDGVGWDVQQMPTDGSMRYATNGTEQDATAGIYDAAHDLGTDGRSQWLVYLGTSDVDAAAARVGELGGTVLGEPVESPYGRMVDARDPDGALFRIIAA